MFGGQILQDLEKLTDLSERGTDVRHSLSICQSCLLQTSPYALCFYRQRLNKISQNTSEPGNTGNNQVTVMFVSRDPNIDLQEIKFSGSPTKAVTRWVPPRRHGLGFFFDDFLVNNNAWSRFIGYLQNTKSAPIPRFYWTHMVKCHAYNDKSKVDSAIDFCIKYLCEEIKQIKPILIITAGLDVAANVYKCMNVQMPPKITFNKCSSLNETAIKNGKGIVVIPHPSQAPYQMWKQGRFQTGITFNSLENLINSLV
ncbi:MAG: uracil-DNA glycosylase family protein [candidate division WOR-3 bacterium]